MLKLRVVPSIQKILIAKVRLECCNVVLLLDLLKHLVPSPCVTTLIWMMIQTMTLRLQCHNTCTLGLDHHKQRDQSKLLVTNHCIAPSMILMREIQSMKIRLICHNRYILRLDHPKSLIPGPRTVTLMLTTKAQRERIGPECHNPRVLDLCSHKHLVASPSVTTWFQTAKGGLECHNMYMLYLQPPKFNHKVGLIRISRIPCK